MSLEQARQALQAQADPKKAAGLQRFFKTGQGQYGEGDRFIGVVVPKIRALARQHRGLSLADLSVLVKSPIHEERMFGLLLLVDKAQRASKAKDEATRKACFDFYLSHLSGINNWDLVDLTAQHVVGAYLFDKDRSRLDELARSKRLWDRRVAILSTFYFIYQGDFQHTLVLCERLLDDPTDLMHKATGWMLREVGKRGGRQQLIGFLEKFGRRMPRTMLRYAIEHFDEEDRRAWLSKTKAV